MSQLNLRFVPLEIDTQLCCSLPSRRPRPLAGLLVPAQASPFVTHISDGGSGGSSDPHRHDRS
eukprot:3052212-Rhodomonas_salina.2